MARASAKTVLVDIFQRFGEVSSGGYDKPNGAAKNWGAQMMEELKRSDDEGHQQALQRLLAAVTELHSGGFLIYRQWNDRSWFAQHPAMAAISKAAESDPDALNEVPATLMIIPACNSHDLTQEDLAKLHPALDEINTVLIWYFDNELGYRHEESPPKTKFTRTHPAKRTPPKSSSSSSSKTKTKATKKTITKKEKKTAKTSTTSTKKNTKKAKTSTTPTG